MESDMVVEIETGPALMIALLTSSYPHQEAEHSPLSSPKMDFFKQPDNTSGDGNSSQMNQTGAWSFGGFMKSLATKSESAIQNYRRDLEQFGSELRKETAVIREVASRAVKDFPASLDVGASVVQDSLESVGQAVDDIGTAVWKSTAKILVNASENDDIANRSSGKNQSLQRYSRFEAQLRAIQSDVNTYVEEPEDSDNYYGWKLGFRLDEKGEEIATAIRENVIIAEIYGEVVPSRINRECFWSRYFYKIHQLKQAEEARAEIVKRAISGNEEEDLSWDIEEEEEGESSGTLVASDKDENGVQKMKVKLEDKSSSEGRSDNGDSCKDSDVSIVSTQPSMPGEEDLGWDEIEDIRTMEESRGITSDTTTNKINLHSRLRAAEEEGDTTDLSWDLDDDGESVGS